MAKVRVIKGDNRTGFVDESQLATARAQGWQPATEEDVTAAKLRREASTGLGTFEAGTQAVARGVSLGLSDSLLRAGGVDARRMNANRESLGEAGTALEVAGAIAPALLSGGTGAAATAARFTLAGRTAQVGRAISGATEAALGRGVVGRVAGGAAAGVFEGGIAGMGAAASEAALGDRDLAAEQLLAGAKRAAGLGALFGAGSTTLGIGLERAYAGTRRVSDGLLERAMGAGDAAPGPDGLVTSVLRRQIGFLRGSPDDLAAGERALARTRTESGRKLSELADAKPSIVDAAVGARVRAAAAASTADSAVEAWITRWSPSSATRKAVAARGWDGAGRMKGVPASKAVSAFRRALRATEPETIDDYLAQRDKVAAALERLRGVGDDVYERGAAAAREFLEAGDDAALWGGPVATHRAAITAAQQAEAAALKRLTPTARAAMAGRTTTSKGAPLDPAKLDRALGKADPAAVAEVLAARRALADALDGAGQDVAALRRGIDDAEQAAGYRGEVAAAQQDLRKVATLRARDARGQFQDPAEAILPQSAQDAVKALRGVAKGTGLGAYALRGLSLGGTALGQLVRTVGNAAGRPASVLRTIAAARGGIDAVRARQGAAVAAFGRLADGVADGAARAGRGADATARRVPPAVARQQQRQRRQEALDTLARVTRLASDPDEVAKEMGPATVQLRAAAPSVAGSVIAGAARAAAYLRSVAPPVTRPTGAPRDVQMVDPFALDAWVRKADAVADPPAALDRAAAGTLTRDEAEALAAVYPRMWADFQEQIMVEVGARARDGRALAFAARNALGTIGGVAADDSLRPGDFATIQASMSTPPPHPAAPPPRSQIKPTAPNLPKWQELESKA